MKWTVVYLNSAHNHLADLWVNASDRAELTRAADLVDRRMRRDPYASSESRDDSSRVMIEPPLVAAYDVSDGDCMVTVWAFWRSS